MRKVFLCALAVFGFMNLCFAQFNVNSERISVKQYDSKGLSEEFMLRGEKAASFDIPAYIKENDHLERLVINGAVQTNLSTTIIKFDSQKQDDYEGDFLCSYIVSKKTPFLGVFGTGKRDKNGVDVKRIIATTSAERAGMTSGEIITAFDGKDVNQFSDLQKAVLSSEIGQHVTLKFHSDEAPYSKKVILGSRGLETITYHYCPENSNALVDENVSSREAVSFTAFPNPTTSLSQVNFSSASDEDVTFSVTDITGRLIHEEVYTDFTGNLKLDYNFDTEQNGTYILHIQQGKEVYNRKVQLIKE